MERRTFVTGAFGLAVLAAGAGVFGVQSATRSSEGTVVFTTPQGATVEGAAGPIMQAGIDLVERGSDERITGCYDGADLFSTDKTGAALVTLADGSRSIDDIAAQAQNMLGAPVDPAETASFFVTLGQAGYLQNEVIVNLIEVAA